MSINYIPAIIVGNESWQSFSFFNPNAFPSYLRKDVMACGDKLALITYSNKILQKSIKNDVNSFIKTLHFDGAFRGFIPDPNKPVIALYHNMRFHAGFQSFFISIKSFLDIYAKLISKLINKKCELKGFSKSIFKGKKIAGGTFLKWVENSVAQSYSNKEKLKNIFLAHIENWIDDLVKYRDGMVHSGRIKDLADMQLFISKKPEDIAKKEIVFPILRNKGPVTEYCNMIIKELNNLIKETLMLLPNINLKLLRLN